MNLLMGFSAGLGVALLNLAIAWVFLRMRSGQNSMALGRQGMAVFTRAAVLVFVAWKLWETNHDMVMIMTMAVTAVVLQMMGLIWLHRTGR